MMGMVDVRMSRRDQPGNGLARECVQVEAGDLTLLEMEQTRARDHCRVVSRETRRWSEDACTRCLATRLHRSRESRIACNPSAQNYSAASERSCCSIRLLNERAYQRILESARDVGLVSL